MIFVQPIDYFLAVWFVLAGMSTAYVDAISAGHPLMPPQVPALNPSRGGPLTGWTT